MIEKEVADYLRGWLEGAGFSVYANSEFHVKGGRRRPDMVVVNKENGINTVFEIKRSRDDDIFQSYKIIDYARAYCDGIKYVINGLEIHVTNFLVATELSKKGRLFANDVPYNEKRRKKQAEFYEKINYIEPYSEWARTGDFVRSIWRLWNLGYNDKGEMTDINIGILLSTANDKQNDMAGAPLPKMFAMHFTKKGQWRPWWKRI